MKVLFVASFLGSYSVHRAQMELVRMLHNEVDELFLVGEFSEDNIMWFQKKEIPVYHTKIQKKVDSDFINRLKMVANDFNPDIIHVINSRLIRHVNIAFKNHPAKVIGYFGSLSLYWHDPSSYFTFLSPRVDKIICNSNHVYHHVRKQLLWRKNKAVKIYKGYDVEWFQDVVPFDYSLFSIPDEAIVVVLAGTHTKNKRIVDFINSYQYLETNKEVHYIVLGHGTDKEDLQQARQLNTDDDKIHLLGLRKDAVELIRGADIYVQTSLKEGFGRAVSEAMSVAKPIVMTACGGGTELIDEESGMVVATKNPKAIAEAISTLVNDDELRLRMGECAKKRMAEVYPISKTLESSLALYKSLVNKK